MDLTDKIVWGSIFLILALFSVGYFPTIIINTQYYKLVSAAVIGCSFIYVFFYWKKILQKFGNVLIPFTLAYLILSYFVTLAYDKEYFINSLNYYLAFFLFSLGFLAPDISRKKLFSALSVFAIFACFMGVYSVVRNVGAFAITQQYAIMLKNSSGAIVAMGTIVSIYLFLFLGTNKLRYIWVLVAFLTFGSLLVFRARSALVGTLLCFLVFVVKALFSEENANIRSYVLLIIFTLVVLAVLDIIPVRMVYDALFANKDITSADDMTSGRTQMFRLALDEFYKNNLAASLATGENLRSIDNYVMNIIGRSGIIGMVLNFPPYFYVLYLTINGVLKSSLQKILPYLCLTVLCVISLTEAPFPFGPGTACGAAYIILGLFLNLEKNASFNYN